MTRCIPGAQLVIYKDAGHGGIFQCHADFVPKALSFLDKSESHNEFQIGEGQ